MPLLKKRRRRLSKGQAKYFRPEGFDYNEWNAFLQKMRRRDAKIVALQEEKLDLDKDLKRLKKRFQTNQDKKDKLKEANEKFDL